MSNPTIAEAKVSPSGQMLYITPKKADGSPALFAISAVADGATITKNGVTTPLTGQVWSEACERVWWPIGPGDWEEFRDDNDPPGTWDPTGTWDNKAPFDGVGGQFGGTVALNGQFRESNDPSATATWTLPVPGPAQYEVLANLYDLAGPDRTTKAVYTVKDGSGAVLGSFSVDLTADLYTTRNDADVQGFSLVRLGAVTLGAGTSLKVTLSNAGTPGTFLVADAIAVRRVYPAFMAPGDVVTVTLPAGVVTVDGQPTDAVTLPVTIATEAEMSIPVIPPAARTLGQGYNLDLVRQNWDSVSLADRGFGSDPWLGPCTLDAHYEMTSCSGTITRPLTNAGTGDRLSQRGMHMFVDGDIKVEFNTSGASFDVAARANCTLVGDRFDIGPATWTDLGAGRWRMTQTVARKPWEPIATRTREYDPRWALDLVFQSANPGLVITRWSWFDSLTPAGYTGTAHPKDVERLKGKTATVRSMDIIGTNDSRAAFPDDFLSLADRHPPDLATHVDYAIFNVGISEIGPVDLDPATDAHHFFRYFDRNGYSSWVVATVDNAEPFLGRDGTTANIGIDPAASFFNSTVPGTQVQFSHALSVHYLDPTHLLIQCYAAVPYDDSQSPPQRSTLDNTYTLPPGVIVGVGKTDSMPIEYFLGYCHDIGASPWINVPHLASDVLIDWLADKTIAGTPDGRKCYFEYSNEAWNNGFGQYSYWPIMQTYANWQHAQDPTNHPYAYNEWIRWYFHKAALIRDRIRARFVAAGRDPNLVVGIAGSQADGGIFTQLGLMQLVEEGLHVDGVCVDGYQGIDPSGGEWRGPDVEGSFARLGTSGRIDALALATFHANKFGVVHLHRLLLNDNGHADAQLLGYETGWAEPGLHGTQSIPLTTIAMMSHPRMYRMNMALLSLMQQCGFTVDNRYRYAAYSDLGSEHFWTDLTAAFQAPGTGKPTENKNPVDYPNTVSQLLGGRLGWATGVDPDATQAGPGGPGGTDAATIIDATESALAAYRLAAANVSPRSAARERALDELAAATIDLAARVVALARSLEGTPAP